MKNSLFFLSVLIGCSVLYGQETYYNQSRHSQFVNPSFYGVNASSFAGVGYNTLSYQNNEKIDSKIFYGAVGFENLNFSLGLDFSNFKINTYGLTQNAVNLTYVYAIEISNDLFFLPGVSLGFGSNQLENESLIFGDQLNLTLGSISTTSNDPLFFNELSTNFLDFGASAVLYNENFLLGLSAKHLNQPDISFNQEFKLKKPLFFSAQAAYERDLNYYGRGFLPENTYLYLYASYATIGDLSKIYASQEIMLGGFSFGFQELYTTNPLSSALLTGINIAINVEQFEFNFSYNIPLSDEINVLPPSVFELSMILKFDRFLRNNKGFFKHLKVDGL
jgi:type IX secretion system PorP/SprF family membrane protein